MEQLQYLTTAQLRALSLSELQSLWELVPTDRQRAYKAAYDREVRTAGAVGSDALEQQVATELLKRYDESALVPVGARWARTPGRVQTAARSNRVLDAPETESAPTTRRPTPQVMAVIGLASVLFVSLMLTRVFGAGASTHEVIATPEVSPTLEQVAEASPTATPLALEAQDDVIQGGDTGREVAYPVNLQVMLPEDSIPRVWVIQRRRVGASEWKFDPNPDTASFVNGLSVRPVIGVPWSEENAAFFARIADGTTFLLTMNTGAVLRFEFADRQAVRRNETTIFRQVSPGLVLLLIGETDADGFPTATRTLITATYPPEQELTRDGQMVGLAETIQTGPVGSPLPLGAASLTVNAVQLIADAPDLPTEMQYLVLEVEVTAGETTLQPAHWRLEFSDATGEVYTPNAAALAQADVDALPTEIMAWSSLSASVGYLIPRSIQTGRWWVTDATGTGVVFDLTLTPPASASLDLRYDGVDVRLVSVTYTEGALTTQIRLYNGRTESLSITQDDIWLALGYASNPPGPRNPAEGLTPFELLPEQAVDLTLVWYWRGEPYAALQVGDYRYAIQISP